MKKMRMLSILLVLAMLLSVVPTGAFANGQSATVKPETAAQQTAQTVKETSTDRLTSPLADRNQALAENAPQQAQSVKVEKTEKPENLNLIQNEQGVQPEEMLYDANEMVRAIVLLEDKGLLERGFSAASISAGTEQVVSVRQTLRQRQEVTVAAMERVVRETAPEATVVVRYNYTIAANGMAVEVPCGALAEIRQLPGVKAAFLAPQYSVPQDMTDHTMVQPYTHITAPAIGAVQAWEAGFSGEGMRIAIVDTGLDLDHPSFAAAPPSPSLTKEELTEVMPELNATQRYQGLNADRLYYSEKIPFAFNYVDGTLDATHDNDGQGDHGTHVAGISAANRLESTDVVGVAPDAQVLVMKIFGANGGAYFDDILATLEDCYVLDVDVANYSLGTPAGFSSVSPYIDEIFARVLETDMVLAIAGGNSYSAASMNGTGTNVNQTSDPDNGIISTPATYIGSTSVASLENSATRFNYVELENGVKVPFNDVSAMGIASLYHVDPQHRAEYVMVPGVGSAEDFAGLAPTTDAEGNRLYAVSFAVIERGGIDFISKQTNAAMAGFDACLVYDNVEGDIVNMADAGLIPNAFIAKSSGEAMLEAAGEDRWGILYLKDVDDTATVPSSLAGKMSDFSSWGVTPSLVLDPEVTAPGGNIYSTLTNGHYGMMSGTSMASPQVAGLSALILEYLHETYPDMTDAQLHMVAESLLMSTAEPVMEFEGVPYSPRKQGAGAANVYSAITSPAYLTAVNGAELTPKISFGDNDAKTGVYHFTFDVHNLTGETLQYTLFGQAMTDQFVEADGVKYMSETARALDAAVTFAVAEKALDVRYDFNGDIQVNMSDVQDFLHAVNGLKEIPEGYDFNGDGKVNTADVQKLYKLIQSTYTAAEEIEVPAEGSVRVHATVTLSEADMAYMDENYPNGIYVDGFVRLFAESEDGVDLSLPFLGFHGDWSQAPAIDDAWYYDPNAVPERYMNVLFTDYGTTSFNLGLNPYILEDYDPEHNVLSPNGDGYSDQIMEIYLGMMRSARRLDFTWLDAEGNELYNAPYDYAVKNYYFANYGIIPPLVYSEVCRPYDFRNPDGSYTVENMDRVQLRISALLDDGDDFVDQMITTDIVIDTEAPTLDMTSMVYDYDEATDTRTLTFSVADNYDIAAVVPLTKAQSAFEYIPVTNKVQGVDGESATITLDVSDYDGSFLIAVCDYGTNESYYEISFDGQQNYRDGSFFGYRLLSQIPSGDGYIYLSEGYNGWNSFVEPGTMLMHTSMFDDDELYTYAAEYIDGYIIGVDSANTIYATELGKWERTNFSTLGAEVMFEFYPGGYEVGDYYMMDVEFPALDMAFDYTTDTLYVLTDESLYLGPNTGGYLLKLDWITGEAEAVGRVTGLTDDHQALTLACDNDGVLYTVDAVTGDLYTINKETAEATFVGATGYQPLYQQSMTVDHETNKLYWAAYQDVIGQSALLELDKATGEILSAEAFEYNSQLSGLFKPHNSGKDLIPDDAQITSLMIQESNLTMRPGDMGTVHCAVLPYNAKLNPADVFWSSSDETVATVSGGIITAVKTGETTITATMGELTASVAVKVVELSGEVYLFDYGTDISASNAWQKLEVNNPNSMTEVAGAMSVPAGFISAAYVDDTIYAFDSLGSFYRLDAETMQGEQISRTSAQTMMVVGMAYNYADGFMYGLAYDGMAFHLCHVNLYTGDLRIVVGNLDSMYGVPIGGMAIDYNGRFYFLNVDSMDNLKLDSYTVMDDGWMYTPMDYVTAPLNGMNCYSFSSLVWSEDNNGLFWANDQGQFHWIGTEVGNRMVESEWGDYEEMYLETSPIFLGNIPGTVSPSTGMAMIMGLLEIPENAPERPQVNLESAALVSNLTVPADGGTVEADLSVEPWNAQYSVEFTTSDETVALVDAQGVVTGVKPGNATITAAVYGSDGNIFETLTCEVKVVNSNVDLFMFMLTDGAMGGDAWIRVSGIDPDVVSAAATYSSSMYAGAYYDGKVYGVGPAGEEYSYKNHLMRIDADTFFVEEVYPEELPFDIRDMAFDYTTGTMYGIAEGGEHLGAVCQLDLNTGAATVVADSGQEIVAMSCDANGQLFALTADGWLCKLDKYTAELEYINQATGSLTDYQSMHYDYVTGNTYWGHNALYLVDTVNGTMTGLGQIGGGYMLVNSLFTIPENEPAIPDTVEVTGVKLAERAAVIKGETTQLTATVLPISVSQVDKTVTWSSSDETVATVDANGLVTGLTGGTTTITVSAGDYSASCVVTVLAEAQKFYAYDETATRWVQIDTKTGELTTVKQETGVAPIMSAADTGEAIYAFDDDGYFYTIDPDTFDRTKVGDGINGMTQEVFDGFSYYPVDVDITDLSYDPETGRLFGLVSGVYDDYEVGLYMVYNALVEINLQPGRMNPYTWEEMELGDIIFVSTYDGSSGIYRPGNLLMHGGYAYSVDTWFSGILSRVSVEWDPWMEFYYAGDVEQLAHVNQLEWGMFYDSRSMVYDPVFDKTYTFHDLGLDDWGKPRGTVTLCTINLGNASTSVVCDLGSGYVLNSLIIR